MIFLSCHFRGILNLLIYIQPGNQYKLKADGIHHGRGLIGEIFGLVIAEIIGIKIVICHAVYYFISQIRYRKRTVRTGFFINSVSLILSKQIKAVLYLVSHISSVGKNVSGIRRHTILGNRCAVIVDNRNGREVINAYSGPGSIAGAYMDSDSVQMVNIF